MPPERVLEQVNFGHRVPNALVYTAFNQEQAIQIDRLHGIRSITLYGHGNFNFATNTATATAQPEFVTDIRLTVGGGTVLFAGSIQNLHNQNIIDYGAVPSFSNAVNGAPGNGKAVSFVAILDLQTVGGKAPIDTALISRLFSSIELRARIGDITNLATGLVSADGTFTDWKIDVSLDEVVNMKDGFGRFVKKVSFVERELTSTQTEFVIPLPTGNMIKTILISTKAAGALVNTIINNIKVQVGGEILFDKDGVSVRGENLLRKDINTQPAGQYHVDFNPDILLSEGANLSQVASLGCNLVLDCTKQTGTNLIRALVTEIIPVR